MTVHCITPNAAIDITYRMSAWQVHGVNRVTEVSERPGGKGVNVARLLDAQGVPTAAYGFVGGSSGARLGDLLTERSPGVQQRWTTAPIETRRTIAVVDEQDTTMFNESGDPISDQDWAALTTTVADACVVGDVVTVSGSLPPGSSPHHLADLVRAVRAAGAVVIVDTSGPAISAAAAAGADVLKPNHHELAEVTGTTDLSAGIHTMLDAGASAVVVSRGEDGLVLGTQRGRHQARLGTVLQGNPTGAGDAVVAALAAGLANGSPDKTLDDRLLLALPHAVAWSAAAVLSPVAGEIDTDQAGELMNDVTLKDG